MSLTRTRREYQSSNRISLKRVNSSPYYEFKDAVHPRWGISQTIVESARMPKAPKVRVQVIRPKRKYNPYFNSLPYKVKKHVRSNIPRVSGILGMNPVLIQKTVSYGKEESLVFKLSGGTTTVVGPIAAADYTFASLHTDTAAAVVDSQAVARANVSCLAKLSQPDNVDLGVGLGELRETLQFLRKPFKSLTSMFQAHARKTHRVMNQKTVHYIRKKTPRDFHSVLSDTWLEYRYAFSPLAKDVTGIMIEATEQADVESKRLRRVVGKSSVPTVTTKSAFTLYQAPYGLYVNGEVVKDVRQRVYSCYRYQYAPYMSDAIRLASVGLSPTQLLSTAYELVPFSFVVDWAYHVGDWLRAWEWKPWIKHIDSCITTKTLTTVQVNGAQANVLFSFEWKPVEPAHGTRLQLSRVLGGVSPPLTPPQTVAAVKLFRTLDVLSFAWNKIPSTFENFWKHRKR